MRVEERPLARRMDSLMLSYDKQEIAVEVESVSKRFGKEKKKARRPWQFWRKPQPVAAAEHANGHNGELSGRNGQDGAEDSGPVMAVDNVSLTVRRGQVFGILGANGSGKSTLIRLMATLLLPDSGWVTVFGHDVVKEEAAVKRLINRVSVEAAFFKKLSPVENLLYAGRLYGLRASDAIQNAEQILKRLDVPKRAYRQPLENLSRGQQQKVAIARALLTSPVLLLLDEPTTGLDPRSKREVQTFLREVHATHDSTIVLTTHDMYEADGLCDVIAIMDNGKIIALDTPAGLKQLAPETNGHEPTLEEVFMHLTGKELVDETSAE